MTAKETNSIRELPQYQSHKKVRALCIKSIEVTDSCGNALIYPVEEGYAPIKVSREYMEKHEPHDGGYWVLYEGGYQSFSPAQPFLKGNKPVNRKPYENASPIMQHFSHVHLPAHLREISEPIHDLALMMDSVLVDGPEKSAGLRKLLEAKDCLVRSRIQPTKPE